MHLPIFFLTDFGHSDPYVGIMKAVALGLGQQGAVLDIVHDIAPQDILSGAIALEDTLPWLPEACCVVAVVDPGVGTSRRCLAVKLGGRMFVGPDNGLLTPVFRAGSTEVREIAAGGPIVPARSATFHGRDVFTPAAALVATGQREFQEIGPPVTDPRLLEMPNLEIQSDDSLVLTILRSDHFGNMATNLRTDGVPEGVDLSNGEFYLGEMPLGRLKRTFGDAEAGHPVVYFNAADRLEVAISMGSARDTLAIGRGDTILFRPNSK